MKLKQTIFTSLLAVPAMLVVSSAQAAPITGQANIAGNVDVGPTFVNFAPTFVSTTGAMETGDFSGLTGGTIKSLSGGPATGATFIPQFVSFTTGVASPIYFDLTFISPGVGSLAGCASSAPGAACTPAGSPFTLFQLTSNTVVATLQLNGVSYTGTAATGTSPTVSVFSTQTAINGTIPQILSVLNSGGSLTGITYSASFVATPGEVIPEPASMLLVGVGLVGAGLVARRRYAK